MRPKPKPGPIRDLRGFYHLLDFNGTVRAEAARFSDGRVIVAMEGGAFYPHASMSDAQRVHEGMTFSQVNV